MKRIRFRQATVIAVIALLALGLATMSAAALDASGTSLQVGTKLPGELVTVRYDDIVLRGFILDDTMMVPIRPVAEAFKATVHWDPEGQTVVNGYIVDVVIRWDQAWMPAKDLVPILGCWYTWDQATRTVTISNGFRNVYIQAPLGIPYPTGKSNAASEAPTGASNTALGENSAQVQKDGVTPRIPGERREPKGKVALTFDDGPDPVITGKIVDTLARYQVKASFFFIGWRATSYADVAKKVARAGHDIGNHSYSHKDLKELDLEEARQEIRKAQNAIKAATGVTPKWFRPPYGSYNDDIRAIAKEEGASIVLWNLTPDDWKNPGEAVIRKRVTSSVKDGSIVLLHVREQTLSALPRLIEELTEMGYELVGLSEII
ncbi:MAG: polysaccharide deacetylase family protein [Firmicutes bacterium]|nr:polysaccharide deacetylase family protein [Bacillota bacterium]